MRWLAWDSTSSQVLIVVMQNQGSFTECFCEKLGELNFSIEFHYSEKLLWAIHQVLSALELDLKELDFLGVGVGPGSFSGLRVGLATARTFAHVLKKPLVGVPSLGIWGKVLWDHYAAQSPLAEAGWGLIARPACQGEGYLLWGKISDLQFGNPLISSGPIFESVGRWEDLVARVVSHLASLPAPKECVVVGEGASLFLEYWNKQTPQQAGTWIVKPAPQGCEALTGLALGQLVWEAWKRGLAQPALSVQPRYLRAPNAELNLRLKTV